jgi:hypothetical protein
MSMRREFQRSTSSPIWIVEPRYHLALPSSYRWIVVDGDAYLARRRAADPDRIAGAVEIGMNSALPPWTRSLPLIGKTAGANDMHAPTQGMMIRSTGSATSPLIPPA